MKTVHIVYFSGTGGTAKVVNSLEQAFSRHGLTVRATELNGKACLPVEADLTVLAYPVYAANAPVPVDEWIEQAQPGKGASAAVVSVSGGGDVMPNTACRSAVIKRLEGKGYRVCCEGMFVMPSNVFVAYDDRLTAMLLRAAPKKAEAFVADILAGKRNRTQPLLLDRLISKLCAVEKIGSKYFGKRLHTSDGCVGCAWCAEHCPRGNIVMLGGRPKFGDRCVICLRCVYGCPKRAIIPSLGKVFILKQGFDLNAMETRTSKVAPLPPTSEVAKGILLKGVKKYLDELQ